MYIKLQMNPVFNDLNSTRFARRHFRGPKSLIFQGPPLPIALKMDLSPSNSLRPAPYKQQVHLYLLLILPLYYQDIPVVAGTLLL